MTTLVSPDLTGLLSLIRILHPGPPALVKEQP